MKKRKPFPGARKNSRGHRPGEEKNQGRLWLYGLHAVRAALRNPRRHVHRLVATPRAIEDLRGMAAETIHLEPAEMEAISRLLPQGAVHQGVALLCDPLPKLDLEGALAPDLRERRIVAVLDQLTDPHNVGAVLRSCAAFDVSAVVVQDRHAPPESGMLAKAASGALDLVPYVEVVNIARAIEELGRMGFWRIALAGETNMTLREATTPRDIALVLGAEGAGLRRLVRERCDVVARIPISGAMESLNVSNAAAVALYELRRA
ncbi:MAG: 23S rRNA (guanosine(2251)-2'-O)-methyltransferase RlmB [Alphaproteobacteria bacterium]